MDKEGEVVFHSNNHRGKYKEGFWLNSPRTGTKKSQIELNETDILRDNHRKRIRNFILSQIGKQIRFSYNRGKRAVHEGIIVENHDKFMVMDIVLTENSKSKLEEKRQVISKYRMHNVKFSSESAQLWLEKKMRFNHNKERAFYYGPDWRKLLPTQDSISPRKAMQLRKLERQKQNSSN